MRRISNGLRAPWMVAALLMGLVLTDAMPAVAQDVQQLLNRIQRLERALSDLERATFAGGAAPATTSQSAPTTGGAVTTAPIGGGGSGGGSGGVMAARTEVRLQQLEKQIRTLTGRVEEVSFNITQVATRVDKLISDIDYRMGTLESTSGGQSRSGAQPQASAPASSASTTASAASNMAQPTTPQTIATATPPAAAIAPQGQAAGSSLLKSDEPGVLGTLTQSDLQRLQTKSQQATGTSARSATALPAAPKPPTTPSATASEASEPALPVGSPQERYRYAFQFLKKQQFAKAERSFKAFLEEHPDDPLAGNVSYWLGETYYVRGDYLNAAVTFAQGYQTYPASPKTADNLLKLAMTLARLKRSEDACFAFDRLREQFPNASSNIKRRAHLEETRLKCPA